MNFYFVKWVFDSRKNCDKKNEVNKAVEYKQFLFSLPSAKGNVGETSAFESCFGAMHSET